jgi:hypothetical protein
VTFRIGSQRYGTLWLVVAYGLRASGKGDHGHRSVWLVVTCWPWRITSLTLPWSAANNCRGCCVIRHAVHLVSLLQSCYTGHEGDKSKKGHYHNDRLVSKSIPKL